MGWKTYPADPLYEVSSCGLVRKVMPAGLPPQLIPIHLSRGYPVVKLRYGIKRLHRMLCETFKGEPPLRGHHAAHNNGLPRDYTLGNLRWASPKENSADIKIHAARDKRLQELKK